MPDGATASLGDVAPDQSPVLVPDLALQPGLLLSFEVTGGVAYDPNVAVAHPDGDVVTLHYPAPGHENGISHVRGPADALMGVFLAPEPPGLSAAPWGPDFVI